MHVIAGQTTDGGLCSCGGPRVQTPPQKIWGRIGQTRETFATCTCNMRCKKGAVVGWGRGQAGLSRAPACSGLGGGGHELSASRRREGGSLPQDRVVRSHAAPVKFPVEARTLHQPDLGRHTRPPSAAAAHRPPVMSQAVRGRASAHGLRSAFIRPPACPPAGPHRARPAAAAGGAAIRTPWTCPEGTGGGRRGVA
jgi:hypothetical protein